MTTEAKAKLYEARHVLEWEGIPFAVHNPLSKPIEDLPVIYGFNNGGRVGLLSAVLIAEDGTSLGGHCCSFEGYMPHDLGCIEGARPDRHEEFQKHYPDGYRMEFVGHKNVEKHEKLMAAIGLANAKALSSQSCG
jgi:hypothetical protein